MCTYFTENNRVLVYCVVVFAVTNAVLSSSSTFLVPFSGGRQEEKQIRKNTFFTSSRISISKREKNGLCIHLSKHETCIYVVCVYLFLLNDMVRKYIKALYMHNLPIGTYTWKINNPLFNTSALLPLYNSLQHCLAVWFGFFFCRVLCC